MVIFTRQSTFENTKTQIPNPIFGLITNKFGIWFNPNRFFRTSKMVPNGMVPDEMRQQLTTDNNSNKTNNDNDDKGYSDNSNSNNSD